MTNNTDGGKTMGRELRRVPPNWNHPRVIRRNGTEGFQPMYDKTFADAAREWKTEFAKWESGWRPEGCSDEVRAMEFWEYEQGPPEHRAFYRPWKDEEATWWQVWETVSEGTPVSPPFETQAELVEYLVEHGDWWDQKRREEGRLPVEMCQPWSRKAAESFVYGAGWAPSGVFDSSHGFRSGVQALGE